jgi:soluble lytic murein transglycosylase
MLGAASAALDDYSHALELAGTPAYRAEMLFVSGRLAHQLGRDDLALARLRTLVVELPQQSRAADALDVLADMGRSTAVSPLQAGAARMSAGQYRAALAQFELVEADGPDAGAARVAHAAALAKLGRDAEALAELESVAAAFPAQAGPALLAAGRVLERNGQYADADTAYSSTLERAPGSDVLPQALFRAGLMRYAQEDWSGAAAIWQQALEGSSPAPGSPSGETTPGDLLRAQLQFWRGKAIAKLGGAAAADAQAAWSAATELAPDSYYGLRARDMLGGALVPGVAPDAAAPTFDLPPSQQQERLAWLASLGLTPKRVASDLAAEPGLGRADQLVQLGLRAEAGWELDGLARRYVAAHDLAHLDALGEWAMSRGLPEQALAVAGLAGEGAPQAVGADAPTSAGGTPALPRPLLRSLYPAGYSDLVTRYATAKGVDPLLLLAIVRQESSFMAGAQSRAGALGLAQVVPATGQSLAQQLGQADRFDPGQLLQPEVNLEYGATYLANVARRYGGRLFPIVASYNAGPGAVDRWLRTFGDDPDLLYELAPFDETHTYMERVYVNYRFYQRLYAQD